MSSLVYYYINRDKMLAQQRGYYRANRARILHRQLQQKRQKRLGAAIRRVPRQYVPISRRRRHCIVSWYTTPFELVRVVPARRVDNDDDITDLVELDEFWSELANLA